MKNTVDAKRKNTIECESNLLPLHFHGPSEADAQPMTGPQQRMQAREPGSRKRELLECVHDTKKYISKAGRGVVKLFQQACGDEDGRGLFQSKVEPYLHKSLNSLQMLTMTACNADGMSNAEIDEFLVEVGLQEVQNVPCDWIHDEANEDSHHNASIIKELRGDIDRLRADNNELRDDNSKMRIDASQLCSQARVAFDKLDKKGRRIGHLEEVNKTLRARIAALEAEKMEINKAQADMQQQCLELRRQVELCPSISPTSTVDNIGGGDTPTHGSCESEDIKTKLQQRDVEVAELQEELKRERELLSRATARNEKIEESLRADIARRKDEMSSKIVLCARLENERDQLQRKVECLQARLDASQDVDDGEETALDRAARNLPEDKKCAAAKMTEAERLALLREQMEWNPYDREGKPGGLKARCKNHQARALTLLAFAKIYKTYTFKGGGIQMEEVDRIRVKKEIDEIATELKSSGCPFLLFKDAIQFADHAKEYIKDTQTLQQMIYKITSSRKNIWEKKSMEEIEKLQKGRFLYQKQHHFFIKIGLYTEKKLL